MQLNLQFVFVFKVTTTETSWARKSYCSSRSREDSLTQKCFKKIGHEHAFCKCMLFYQDSPKLSTSTRWLSLLSFERQRLLVLRRSFKFFCTMLIFLLKNTLRHFLKIFIPLVICLKLLNFPAQKCACAIFLKTSK